MDPSDVAGKVAWSQSVEREDHAAASSASSASLPSSSPPPDLDAAVERSLNGSSHLIANGAAATAASASSSAEFSLFPSLRLQQSPHHHHPSHSIIALSAADPATITAPSPLLSDEPLHPHQPTQLAMDHILSNPNLIVNVWASNLREELAKILHIVDEYPYIAMDTEFPGIVARPAGSHKTSADYQYQTLRTNVDLLKIIQLGLCFCDSQGHIHPGTCTWQFNFHFDRSVDMYAQDSIDLLTKSGIDFQAHEKNGIQTADFAEWLMTSGIVLSEDVKWISFHSGFDFGYLLKILTAAPLPSKEDEFFSLLQLYFPCIYDIKEIIQDSSASHLHGGLSKIAETLNVIRIGPQHQAGSDSLLTAATFFKLKHLYFNSDNNPIWRETPESRHAVYRESKLFPTAQNGTHINYSVITNTDALNEFDCKFMGNLAGLNNEWTSAWKKRQERVREKRHTKELSIKSGENVSSDDDDADLLLSPSESASMQNSSSTTTTSTRVGGISPSFVPSSSNQQPSYLPMTPSKSVHNNNSSTSSHHTFNTPKSTTPSHNAGHRGRYSSHDYS